MGQNSITTTQNDFVKSTKYTVWTQIGNQVNLRISRERNRVVIQMWFLGIKNQTTDQIWNQTKDLVESQVYNEIHKRTYQ